MSRKVALSTGVEAGTVTPLGRAVGAVTDQRRGSRRSGRRRGRPCAARPRTPAAGPAGRSGSPLAMLMSSSQVTWYSGLPVRSSGIFDPHQVVRRRRAGEGAAHALRVRRVGGVERAVEAAVAEAVVAVDGGAEATRPACPGRSGRCRTGRSARRPGCTSRRSPGRAASTSSSTPCTSGTPSTSRAVQPVGRLPALGDVGVEQLARLVRAVGARARSARRRRRPGWRGRCSRPCA